MSLAGKSVPPVTHGHLPPCLSGSSDNFAQDAKQGCLGPLDEMPRLLTRRPPKRDPSSPG